jgi:SAM-dependent methyltransferase
MNSVEKETANLYGEIFTAFTDKEFEEFQLCSLPKSIGEADDYYHGKSVIELGSGGLGHALAGILNSGAAKVTGVDLSAQNIENLKKRFKDEKRLTLINQNILKLEESVGKFDLAYSNGVLVCSTDPQKAVSVAYNLLNPGGKFVVCLYGKWGVIPFCISLSRLAAKVIPKDWVFNFLKKYWRFSAFFIVDYMYAPILIRYTEKEAVKMLRDGGFSDIERLDNSIFCGGIKRYLQQSQMDHKTLSSKILHGVGYITLKGVKKS